MKKRRTYTTFNYRDCDAFAGYLHAQSLKGWHFREFRMGMVFERGEPADVSYAVEVFPKGTEMDTRPEESTKEYAEYCEAAGWKLIDSSRKFCVFRQTKEDAVSIVEPEERYKNIRKAEWLFWLNGAVSVFLLTGLYLIQLFSGNFSRWVFNTPMLFILLFMMLSSGERLFEGVYLLYWSVTRGRMLKAGNIPVYGKKKRWPFRSALPLVFFLVSAVFLWYSKDEYFLPYVLPAAAVLILLLFVTLWIAYRRPSRDDNWIFQLTAGLGIVFCFSIFMVTFIFGSDSDSKAAPENAEDFPLIQTDYRQIDGEITSAHADYMESILGRAEHFYVTYNIENSAAPEPDSNIRSDTLSYTIYQSRYPWILDKLWEDEVPKPKEHPDNRTDMWHAVTAVSLANEHSLCRELVRYPDRILIICSDERLADHQIRSIREKLMFQGMVD